VAKRSGVVEVGELLVEMQKMQRKLHDAGFSNAAHKVNDAMNMVGWTLADRLDLRRPSKEPRHG
jgi:hypothetical protein